MNTKLSQANVVFHIEEDNKQILNIAIINLANLIVDQHKVKAVFVANVKAPALFLPGIPEDHQVKKLAEWVKLELLQIYICNNSLNNLGLDASQLLPFCEVVPAGITQLIKLQQEGFAYIKP